MSSQAVKQHLEATDGGIISERAAEQKKSLLIEDDERWYTILDAAFDPKVRLHRLVTLTHQHQMEDGDLSTSNSTDEMNATAGGEDCGETETSSKTSQDDSHSSETEVSDYYDDDYDYHHDDNYDYYDDDPDSQLKQLSETGPKTEHSDEEKKSTNTVKPFSCSECEERFVNEQSLQNHVSRHARRSAISFVGEECFTAKTIVDSCRTVQAALKLDRCDNDVGDNNKRITSKQIHKVHTVKKPFKCDVCERGYTNKGNLTRHMKDHTEKQPFGCDVREQSYSRKDNLTIHKVHTVKKPFKCNVCERSYSTKASLIRHKIVHPVEKPFHCETRKQRSREKTAHMKSCTGKELFRCDVCERSYSNKSNLSRHMRDHTGKELFRCDVCERSYSSKGSLTKHASVHTVKKLFRCDVCERNFCSKGNLTRHMIVHTVELFRCDVCDRCYCTKGSLTRHMIVHTVGDLPL